jgi:hypothetical protein
MFDVEAVNDIDITSLSFLIYGGGTPSIKVYTANQSYSSIATDSSAWTLIASGSVSIGSKLLLMIMDAHLIFCSPITNAFLFL